MKFSLLICTYKRPAAIERLLQSVEKQELYPMEIVVIDGSPDDMTGSRLKEKNFPKLKYYKVPEAERGLTRQRNYGIKRVSREAEIVCFLDDDIVLEKDYFSQLIHTYHSYPDAMGVGGYIINEVDWEKSPRPATFEEFKMDGYLRKLGSRNLLRKKMGLLSKDPPGVMPEFSNGLSISFLPPSGKVYPVEFFMGGVASYRKALFEKIRFSKYFEGYGLYEDMDFCLRASKLGQLYVNTGARLSHYHEAGGRPNQFLYGKMVLRNGWYVWRVKYSKPSLTGRIMWNMTMFLLTIVRFGNSINTAERKTALSEGFGRLYGWISLFFNKPKLTEEKNNEIGYL